MIAESTMSEFDGYVYRRRWHTYTCELSLPVYRHDSGYGTDEQLLKCYREVNRWGHCGVQIWGITGHCLGITWALLGFIEVLMRIMDVIKSFFPNNNFKFIKI